MESPQTFFSGKTQLFRAFYSFYWNVIDGKIPYDHIIPGTLKQGKMHIAQIHIKIYCFTPEATEQKKVDQLNICLKKVIIK